CTTIQNLMDEEDTNKPKPDPPSEPDLLDEEKIKHLHNDLEEVYKKLLQAHDWFPPHLRRPLWHKLDENKKVVPCSSYECHKQFENFESRIVGRTQLGPYFVSTVFLMLDHGFGGESQWFETMIISEKNPDAEDKVIDRYQWRYPTYEKALEGHETIVMMVREGILP